MRPLQNQSGFIQFDSLPVPATLQALLAANRIDEDPPYRLRRRGKEMAPAVAFGI
jgi:hypothetical protein